MLACAADRLVAVRQRRQYWRRFSANNSDLTPLNDPEYTASGHTGGGLVLDGAADGSGDARVGAARRLPTGNGPYTLSAWVKPTGSTFGTRGGIVGWGNFSGAGRSAVGFRLSASNGLFHTWWNVNLSATRCAGERLRDRPRRRSVASRRGELRWLDADDLVDGNLVNSDAQTTANAATAANFRIGIANGTSSAADYFKGTMDDVAIWNVVPSPNQIGALALGTRPDSLPEAGTGLLAQRRADDLNATLDSGDPLAAWNDTIGARTWPRPDCRCSRRTPLTAIPSSVSIRTTAAWTSFASPPRPTRWPAARPSPSRSSSGAARNGRRRGHELVRQHGDRGRQSGGSGKRLGHAPSSTGRIGAGVGNPDRSLYSSGQVNLADGLPHLAILSRSGSTLSLSIDGLPPVTRTDCAGVARGPLDMVFGARRAARITSTAIWPRSKFIARRRPSAMRCAGPTAHSDLWRHAHGSAACGRG